jgi:hypothetical protein
MNCVVFNQTTWCYVANDRALQTQLLIERTVIYILSQIFILVFRLLWRAETKMWRAETKM